MDLGDLLIRASVRLAMACYAGVLLGSALSRQAPATTSGSRWLWTMGCALFWTHVLSAFAFYHHWSHEHAFRDTAEKTQEALGMPFGYGIYVNHLFTLLWTADVAWSWLSPQSFAARPRWVTISIHAFMLFIAINGLLVFKEGMLRWVSTAVLVGLAGIALVQWLLHATRIASNSPQSRDEAVRP